jgi:hypothetical protein
VAENREEFAINLRERITLAEFAGGILKHHLLGPCAVGSFAK